MSSVWDYIPDRYRRIPFVGDQICLRSGTRTHLLWTQQGQPDLDVYGSSVNLDGVTSALLLWQRAEHEEAGVRLRWAVGSTLETVGWGIDRSDGENLPFRQIAELPNQSGESLDYLDSGPPAPGWYSYRIRALLADGTELAFDPIQFEVHARGTLRWEAVAPNPFRDRLECRLYLPSAGRAEVDFYSPSGRLVRRLFNGDLPAGGSTLVWSDLDRSLSPGVYFVRARFGAEAVTRRVVLMK